MGKKPYKPSRAEQAAKNAIKHARIAAEQEEKAKRKADALAAAERESILLGAGPMRKMKMALAALTKALWKYELTESQRKDIKVKIKQYEKDIKGIPTDPISEEALVAHEMFMREAPELVACFRVFWICMLPRLINRELPRDAFILLNMNLQYVLNDYNDAKIARMAAEDEWVRCESRYGGKINQRALFDFMYETITTWLETFDQMSYTTFMWCLIDSLFDTAVYPPKYRPKRMFRSITKDTESTMLQAWYYSRRQIENILHDAITRAATQFQLVDGVRVGVVNEVIFNSLTYSEGDALGWNLDADEGMQSAIRIQDRKVGGTFSSNEEIMIAAMARSTSKLTSITTQGYEDTDSEPEDAISNIVVGGNDSNEEGNELDDSLTTGELAIGLSKEGGYDSRHAYEQDKLGGVGARRADWLGKGRGQGADTSVHFETHQRKEYTGLKRDRNWIGELQGNIFFDRKSYDKPNHVDITWSFMQYLHHWMEAVGFKKESDVTYAMLARLKAEWLNMRSKASTSKQLALRLDEDRKHIENLHLKTGDLQQSLFVVKKGNTSAQATSGRTKEQMDHDRINMSVKEVMDMISELNPKKNFGESIPHHHAANRIPAIILTGGGDVEVEESYPFTPADYSYAPTYQYNSPKHSHHTQGILNSIRPEQPLRRCLDGGGSYAGSDAPSQPGSHYQYGSHINSTASLAGPHSESMTLKTMSASSVALDAGSSMWSQESSLKLSRGERKKPGSQRQPQDELSVSLASTSNSRRVSIETAKRQKVTQMAILRRVQKARALQKASLQATLNAAGMDTDGNNSIGSNESQGMSLLSFDTSGLGSALPLDKSMLAPIGQYLGSADAINSFPNDRVPTPADGLYSPSTHTVSTPIRPNSIPTLFGEEFKELLDGNVLSYATTMNDDVRTQEDELSLNTSLDNSSLNSHRTHENMPTFGYDNRSNSEGASFRTFDSSQVSQSTKGTRERDLMDDIMFQRNKMFKHQQSLKMKPKENNHHGNVGAGGSKHVQRNKVAFAGILTDEQYAEEKEKEQYQQRDDTSVGSMGSLNSMNSLGSKLSNMGRSVVGKPGAGAGEYKRSGGSGKNPTNGREYKFMDSGDVLEEGIWVSKKALNWETESGFRIAGKKNHKYEASIVK